jgi:adenylosuccinate lyase
VTQRSIFQNISPLDHRYSISEGALFAALSAWLSEEALIGSCIRAEIALLTAHLRSRGRFSPEARTLLERLAADVSADAVYAEEERTRHAIRALVNVLKARLASYGPLGVELAPLVHLGATSADILDSSFAWRMSGAAREVILPELRALEGLLCDYCEREADTPQVGRTHGQHALPLTAGFAMAEYAARLGKSILEIEKRAGEQKGKLSGAVGAYNALCLLSDDPAALERLYLEELGLEASEHSTQLVEPEYLLRLLLEYNTAFGIIANLADDIRNLQRSEIGELFEGFADTQVGSSTMPQKRNPWNSEHVKSLWKEFSPRVMTFFMDQISEHQRDLTNSASKRFVADYVTGFALAVVRMSAIMRQLRADRDAMLRNLRSGSGSIPGGVMAEPAYILLAESGAADAHELVRRLTLKAEQQGMSFPDALSGDAELFGRIAETMMAKGLAESRAGAEDYFRHSERYAGLAAKKAREIARKYRKV